MRLAALGAPADSNQKTDTSVHSTDQADKKGTKSVSVYLGALELPLGTQNKGMYAIEDALR